MSKNFELLQKLGKEDLLNAPTTAGNGNGISPAEVIAVAPVKPGLEEIHSFVQQVFLIAGTVPRSVVFTSTEPGTGCSWVTAHTAEVLAGRIAGSVCVVDANLRDPGLHLQFEMENGPGLSEALQDADSIRNLLRPTSLPNLFVITAGRSTPETQGLVASDRMRMRIHELRSEFDFVLMDAPAVSVAGDAVSAGSASDGVVLVLKANASRKESARQAVQGSQAGNAKVLGAVLNQRQFPIPEALYKRL
jgi:protein-tyrosine kinase